MQAGPSATFKAKSPMLLQLPSDLPAPLPAPPPCHIPWLPNRPQYDRTLKGSRDGRQGLAEEHPLSSTFCCCHRGAWPWCQPLPQEMSTNVSRGCPHLTEAGHRLRMGRGGAAPLHPTATPRQCAPKPPGSRRSLFRSTLGKGSSETDDKKGHLGI